MSLATTRQKVQPIQPQLNNNNRSQDTALYSQGDNTWWQLGIM